MKALRPPLPPPHSHDGIKFVIGEIPPSNRLPDNIVAAIGFALATLLQFENGYLEEGTNSGNIWRDTGFIEGTSR